jgi:hypothetical protein
MAESVAEWPRGRDILGEARRGANSRGQRRPVRVTCCGVIAKQCTDRERRPVCRPATCLIGQRRITENNISLKLTTGVGSRCTFAIRYAPCREATINEASSWQLVPALSSCALTAAVRQ